MKERLKYKYKAVDLEDMLEKGEWYTKAQVSEMLELTREEVDLVVKELEYSEVRIRYRKGKPMGMDIRIK